MTKRIFTVILGSCLLLSRLSAQSKVEIFVDVQGNDTLQKLVTTLTDQLKKAVNADYIVKPISQYNGKGIYLGNSTLSNQPVKPSVKLLQSGVEAFSGEANSTTVQIIGNSNMALGHGIFTYLDVIGYRFYFANADWHIVPEKPNLFPKWSVVSQPAFDHRRIWYGYGTGSPSAYADYEFWFLANRQGGSINAYFGHAYEEIISRNRDTFLLHPEWFYPQPPKGTISPNEPKFDMTREDLIQFLIRDFERRIQASLKNKTNDYKMLSLGPSDGLGTCNTPACQKLGTITDRVYYLVNRVAKAIQKKYPSTYVGCLAYGEYSAPPTNNLEPNVFVGITTAFNSSKLPVDKLVDEWRKKKAFVGIYDYFSWYAWDFDIPGQSLVSRIPEMVSSIKKYHSKGVKAYEAESSTGWISKGLGYYIAAKLMWDIKTDVEVTKKEFFQLCFGKASEVMKQLWLEWEKYPFTDVREKDLAQWIDYTASAEKLEQSPAFKKRIYQVKSYLHFIYLHNIYKKTAAENDLQILLNYGYRKLDDGSVSGYPAFFVLGNLSGIKDMGFVDNPKWKYNNTTVTTDELNKLIIDDRKGLKVAPPVKEYTPTTKFMTIPNISKYNKLFDDSALANNANWLSSEWVFEIKNKSAGNYLEFTGDYLANPTVIKPIKISIYKYVPDGNLSGITPLIYYEYTKTQVTEKISLANFAPGYYTVIFEDPVKIFRFKFPPSIGYSAVLRPVRQISTPAYFHSFLYVPEGTKKFNVIKTASLTIVTPTGREINFAKDKAEDVQVEVQKGEAGLWRMKLLTGKIYVEGIPPFIGVSAPQMLVPVEK